MEYGLTEKGFVAKPFSAILQEERDAWKATFGYEIDTSTETPEGAYIGVQAAKLTQLWEMAEGLFAAGDPDTASGVYLDRLASMVNVQRLPAEATRVYAALWGKERTPIGSGHLAKMSVSGDHFALQESVMINRNQLLGFRFKIAELKKAQYALYIDGTLISYTTVDGDDEAAIGIAIADQIEGVFPGVFEVVNHGDDGIEIHSKAGIVPFVLFCDDEKIEVTSLGVLGIYRAVVAGALFVGIGTLDRIVSNVSDLDRIINYATGITGREKESDAELRLEKNNRQRQASGNELAIKNEIKKMPGVLYCEVYSNRSHQPHDGRPPNCYEAIVIGGMDYEIAEAIFRKGPGGIQPFGNTVIKMKDIEGNPWDIGFSRPENQYIWIKIVFEMNPEEVFPVNGIELLKTKIDEWGAKEQEVGVNVIYQKLNKPIYSVPGIGKVVITVAVTSDLTPPNGTEYAEQNISINERQIALIDKTRVSITEAA